jgi:hypothetical protein
MKWWVESDFKDPSLPLSLRLATPSKVALFTGHKLFSARSRNMAYRYIFFCNIIINT